MTNTAAKPAVADTPTVLVRYQMPLWRKLIAWVAIAAVLLVFLALYDEVLLPFVVGLAVAYFLPFHHNGNMMTIVFPSENYRNPCPSVVQIIFEIGDLIIYCY